MPHARIFERPDGKFELETRFPNKKLRNELAFNTPAALRVFDGRIGEGGRWVLDESLRPQVLAFLKQLDFDIELVQVEQEVAPERQPPSEATPEQSLDEITPELPLP